MILTGPEIQAAIERGEIIYEPFHPRHLNPNSVNFHLGEQLTVYTEKSLDPRIENPTESLLIPPEGLRLKPSRLYLGHIQERIGSEVYVPIIKGRSSVGRLGLFINITADLVDQGAIGQWTMMMHCVQPLLIFPGMSIGQMVFFCTEGEPMLYKGKYQDAEGPRASESWREWEIVTLDSPPE